MAPRFTRKNLIRLHRLLNLQYKPHEIAQEIGVLAETVHRSHLPGGCPFERDARGQVWINGVAYARWVDEVTKRKETAELAPGEAFCFRCSKAVPFADARLRHKGRYTMIYQGICSVCGTRINRAYSAQDGNGVKLPSTPKKRGRRPLLPGAAELDLLARKRVINRANWADVREYLLYLGRVGLEEGTIAKHRTSLRHLLEWAGATSFNRAKGIDPGFPAYLAGARNDRISRPLSPVTMKKLCDISRSFLDWARTAYPRRYRYITLTWIATLRPGSARSVHSEYREHQYYSLESVLKIAALVPENLNEERNQAALCFLFLSAMRAQAFVSLPISAVDLNQYTVDQFPELGVRTKNRKAARTQLLRIPDLLLVVKAWDAKIKSIGLGENDLWYPLLDREQNITVRDADPNWETRRTTLERGIKSLCEKAGIQYLSPHKLRHGHAVFMMRRVRDMRELKSLSQNLMHASVTTTDGIYGRLVRDDIADLYEGIGG